MEREIVQDVLVYGVSVEGNAICVGLYGGTSPICGTVRFTFPDPGQRAANVAILERWERDAVPLTFVSGTGPTISLVNDRAMISRALA